MFHRLHPKGCLTDFWAFSFREYKSCCKINSINNLKFFDIWPFRESFHIVWKQTFTIDLLFTSKIYFAKFPIEISINSVKSQVETSKSNNQ